ncbi:hypothetical protein ALI22I_04660 [Saccharothrix sp. ALI-22-I]|nr:hypothetical protein ALI22I_04660 [Saccharothrix sp. ALI-22-I]
MVAVPEAGTLHDEVGTWKAVVDADTGQILGAALLGCNAGGVISALHMAMLGGLCCQQFRSRRCRSASAEACARTASSCTRCTSAGHPHPERRPTTRTVPRPDASWASSARPRCSRGTPASPPAAAAPTPGRHPGGSARPVRTGPPERYRSRSPAAARGTGCARTGRAGRSAAGARRRSSPHSATPATSRDPRGRNVPPDRLSRSRPARAARGRRRRGGRERAAVRSCGRPLGEQRPLGYPAARTHHVGPLNPLLRLDSVEVSGATSLRYSACRCASR